MAILGFDDYLCEACKHFDSDGDDGFHPRCFKQFGTGNIVVRLGDECPYGYEFGVPTGYPGSRWGNERRANAIKDMLAELGIEVA